jgi:hypothetical protein
MSYIKTLISAGHWWLMPVILVSWEAEIRRLMIRALPNQNIGEIPSQPISVTGYSSNEIGGSQSRLPWVKCETLPPK